MLNPLSQLLNEEKVADLLGLDVPVYLASSDLQGRRPGEGVDSQTGEG
jgi:hypothetical protein